MATTEQDVIAEAALDRDLHQMFEYLNLSENIRRNMQLLFKENRSVKIFVTGRTGVGKSSLVNALIGKKVAKEGDELDPQTSEVTKHEAKIKDVTVTVWDSPGLQDGTVKEEEYLMDMAKNCKGMHLCVYCVSTLENRFVHGCDDIKAMQKLTHVFGQDMWKHVIFLLTFANVLEDDAEVLEVESAQKPDTFRRKVAEWETTLRKVLVEEIGLERNIAENVKAVPAGYEYQPALLDRDYWLSPLWFEALYTMKPVAQPAMIKINVHRIFRNPNDVRSEDMTKFLHEQPLIYSHCGKQIGKIYGKSSVGEAVGLEMGNAAVENMQCRFAIYRAFSPLIKLYTYLQSFFTWIRNH